jgi:hypothetical protein
MAMDYYHQFTEVQPILVAPLHWLLQQGTHMGLILMDIPGI